MNNHWMSNIQIVWEKKIQKESILQHKKFRTCDISLLYNLSICFSFDACGNVVFQLR